MATAISNTKQKQRGFSLIELLVVLVIVAMFSGMIVLSIGDNFSRELRAEAERFQRLVVAASDEAIYTSSQLGVVIDKNRYSLVRFDAISQSWLPFKGQAFRLHSLPESMRVIWSIEGFSRPGSDNAPQDLSFGSNDQVDELDADDIDASDVDPDVNPAALNLMPQILMLSSGEVTAFTVDFLAVEVGSNSQIMSVISDGFSAPVIKSINNDESD
jgi:type II secretion system protein H